MTETPCRIALVQMTSGVDLAANTATLCDAVAQAAAGGAAMLFAPEMALLLDRDRTRATASLAGHALDGAVMAVQTAARQAGIWVHIGSAPYAGNAADPRWRNRTLVIDDQGAIRATYDKIHLFDVALATGESWRESAGYARATLSWPSIRRWDASASPSVTICDLRPCSTRWALRIAAPSPCLPPLPVPPAPHTGMCCCGPAPLNRAVSLSPLRRAAAMMTGA